tara:strand:- start:74 stop:460 length:387 start_codon:yes stop_codon:yes gene_type:complete
MGLDQYAYKRKVEWQDNAKTRILRDEEIMYWRKHNRLQGYMENLWHDDEKYGSMFLNGQDIYLQLDEILELEQVITDKKLPQTSGFFFGGDSYDDYKEYGYEESDQEFLKLAKQAINDGYDVVYNCSW